MSGSFVSGLCHLTCCVNTARALKAGDAQGFYTIMAYPKTDTLNTQIAADIVRERPVT